MVYESKNIRKQKKSIQKLLKKEYELTVDNNPFTNDGFYLINRISKIRTSRHEAITYLMDRFGNYELIKKQFIRFYRMRIIEFKFKWLLKKIGWL